MGRKHDARRSLGWLMKTMFAAHPVPAEGGEDHPPTERVLCFKKNSVLFSPANTQFKKINANYEVIICIFPNT